MTASPGAWLRALRVNQWTKNLLIPVAWFFAVSDPTQSALARGWRPALLMLGMFGSFCLVSSAFYLFNDVRDREASIPSSGTGPSPPVSSPPPSPCRRRFSAFSADSSPR